MGESLKFNFKHIYVLNVYVSIFTDEIWYEATVRQDTTELIEKYHYLLNLEH